MTLINCGYLCQLHQEMTSLTVFIHHHIDIHKIAHKVRLQIWSESKISQFLWSLKSKDQSLPQEVFFQLLIPLTHKILSVSLMEHQDSSANVQVHQVKSLGLALSESTKKYRRSLWPHISQKVMMVVLRKVVYI